MIYSDKDDYFRDKFIDAIVANGTGIDSMSGLARRLSNPKLGDMFERWARLGREIFFVKKGVFINVHVRSEPPGFWGVTKNVINDFHAIKEYLGIQCLFVLLVGQEKGIDQDGYILEDIFSPPMIEKPSEQAEVYKINEKNLDRSKVIHSTDDIAKRLIELCDSRAIKPKKTILRKRIR